MNAETRNQLAQLALALKRGNAPPEAMTVILNRSVRFFCPEIEKEGERAVHDAVSEVLCEAMKLDGMSDKEAQELLESSKKCDPKETEEEVNKLADFLVAGYNASINPDKLGRITILRVAELLHLPVSNPVVLEMGKEVARRAMKKLGASRETIESVLDD